MTLRPQFASRDEYASQLGDAAFWWPYVEEALRRHGLSGCEARVGRVGTFPTFLVDGRHVVKFYSDLFDDGLDFYKELECYGLIERDGGIAAPDLIASGKLFDEGGGWPWPYTITTVLPGRPVAQVWDEMSEADKTTLARWLGRLVRRLHDLALEGCDALRPDWRPFAQMLAETHRNALEEAATSPHAPPWLAERLDEYLGPPDTWFDSSTRPILVHADLHEDHIFVERRGDIWKPSGIIDFGDAIAGDWGYELPALHFGTFGGDKRMLRAFLDSYGLDVAARRDVPSRGLRYTILHQFIKLTAQFEHSSELRKLPDLESVAEALWDVHLE